MAFFRSNYPRAILISCLLLVACQTQPAPEIDMTVVLTAPSGREISIPVELADDDDERAMGLMHRKELARGTGMLFVFEDEKPLHFWMKNTHIPLDILYFNDAREFVSSQSMDPCTTDYCRTYPSCRAARYALEVNAGFVEKEGVGEGWKLKVDAGEY